MNTEAASFIAIGIMIALLWLTCGSGAERLIKATYCQPTHIEKIEE